MEFLLEPHFFRQLIDHFLHKQIKNQHRIEVKEHRVFQGFLRNLARVVPETLESGRFTEINHAHALQGSQRPNPVSAGIGVQITQRRRAERTQTQDFGGSEKVEIDDSFEERGNVVFGSEQDLMAVEFLASVEGVVVAPSFEVAFRAFGIWLLFL